MPWITIAISFWRLVSGHKKSTMSDNGKAALVFSSDVARALAEELRLPPTYVGVRRVRPSNKTVQQAFRPRTTADQSNTKSNVVFKTVDPETGVERRMTRQEKKAHKATHKKEVQAEAKHRLAEKSSVSNEGAQSDEQKLGDATDSNSRYMQLEISKAVLEEELADLRGERLGVPPVALSPAMARHIFRKQNDSGRVVTLDDDLAARWTVQLRQSFAPAEDTRIAEDMRPMAYRLSPEVWKRFRPPPIGNVTIVGGAEQRSEALSHSDAQAISWHSIQSTDEALHDDSLAVVEILYQSFACLHISDGAKFGCDYLLYDGPRARRHAFAGLRVYAATKNNGSTVMLSTELPQPSAYDLTGYVRCLNTASKLALLATVQRSPDQPNMRRVAIVDIALEQIDVPSRKARKRKTLGERMQTLAK